MTQFSSRPAERRRLLILVAAAMLPVFSPAGAGVLADRTWIPGSANCAENRDLPLETVQFDADTCILRQNECSNFEGPFI